MQSKYNRAITGTDLKSRQIGLDIFTAVHYYNFMSLR